jgi:hypothetical protein
MIDAYTIGITLALNNGVSDGIAAIRRDLAALDRAVRVSEAGLVRLRQTADNAVAGAAADVARLIDISRRAALALPRPHVEPSPVLPLPAEPAPQISRSIDPGPPSSTQTSPPVPEQLPRNTVEPSASSPVPTPPEPTSPALSKPPVVAPAATPVPQLPAPIPGPVPPSAAASRARERIDHSVAPTRPIIVAPPEKALSVPSETDSASVLPAAPVPPEKPRSEHGSASVPGQNSQEQLKPERIDYTALVRAIAPAPIVSPGSNAALAPTQEPVAGAKAPLTPGVVAGLPDAPELRTPAAPSDPPWSRATMPEPVRAEPEGRRLPPDSSRMPSQVGAISQSSPAPLETSAPRPATAAVMPSSAPRKPRPSLRPTSANIFLEGAPLGRWIDQHLSRAATRPPSGITGFDPRLTPVWPGAPIGN